MNLESNAPAELQESLNCTFPFVGCVAENPTKSGGITSAQKCPSLGSVCAHWGGRDFGSLFPKLTEEEPLENFDPCLPLCIQTMTLPL